MGSVRRFAAVNTKIRHLEGKMLGDHDYEQLMTCSTLADMVQYMRSETGYDELLADVQTDQVDVEHLEGLFKRELFRKLQGLNHYFTDEYRKLFRILFMRYEIEDLKVFLRAVTRQEHLGELMKYMIILGVSRNLDYQALAGSATLEQVVENLEGSPYQEIIRYYINEEPDKRLFYMEMNLDRLYFKLLAEQAMNLDPRDSEPLMEVLGKNTDILNLQWIYRGLKFYQLSSEELLNYTLGHGLHLKYRHLKELCYARSIEELVDLIKESRYAFLVEGASFERFLEINMERYVYEAFQTLRRKEPMSIVESLVYMHRLEFEIRDLFTLFEAKRYGLSQKEVRPFLVRFSEEGAPHGS